MWAVAVELGVAHVSASVSRSLRKCLRPPAVLWAGVDEELISVGLSESFAKDDYFRESIKGRPEVEKWMTKNITN